MNCPAIAPALVSAGPPPGAKVVNVCPADVKVVMTPAGMVVVRVIPETTVVETILTGPSVAGTTVAAPLTVISTPWTV